MQSQKPYSIESYVGRRLPNFDELAKNLLGVDEAVLFVIITNQRGEVLDMRYESDAEKLRPFDNLLEKAGSLVAIISSLIGQGEEHFGACKYTTIVYISRKIEVIPLKSKGIIVALVTAPYANAEQICEKVHICANNI
jgi:hypothetical protein